MMNRDEWAIRHWTGPLVVRLSPRARPTADQVAQSLHSLRVLLFDCRDRSGVVRGDLETMHRALFDVSHGFRSEVSSSGARPRSLEEVGRDLETAVRSGRLLILVERRAGWGALDLEARAPAEAPTPAPPPPPMAESSGGPTKSSREDKPVKTWIDIELVGEDDLPVPGERYRITLSDGKLTEGRLDGKGSARVEGIDPGTCKVTFPDLDRDAWAVV